jgi:Cu(I)/Ag(I) efflux system membrane fusion protein
MRTALSNILKMRILLMAVLSQFIFACKQMKDPKSEQALRMSKMKYQCPMPQDSVFSELPGECPKCGMALVPIQKDSGTTKEISLDDLLKPTNEFAISNIPVIVMQQKETAIKVDALGSIAYNTKEEGNIASRVSGRIERLYVRYRYQVIQKGDKIMDLYSPEIMTAQQNLLFLLKNDSDNKGFIEAAKSKLLLLGMDEKQLQQVIQSGIPNNIITVYSNFSGHIHESNKGAGMNREPGTMKDISQLTEELSLKEGMYVQKGQSVFSVFNPDYAWAILNIYADAQALVKKGNPVVVVPETAPDKHFEAKIDFIEPFYRKDSKTLTVRVPFNNHDLKIPIGSQVKASINGNTIQANWLPKEAVLSMGMSSIVFIQDADGFKAKKIVTGITQQQQIQVISGISEKDSVFCS